VAEAGFNAMGKNLGIAATLDNWQGAGDARLFKIILSPEFADRLNLQQHIIPLRVSLFLAEIPSAAARNNLS
jgi:hypothetical protein